MTESAVHGTHRWARGAPFTSIYVMLLPVLVPAVGLGGPTPEEAATWVYFAVTVPAYLLFVTTGFAPGPWWPPLVTLLLCALIDGLIALGSRRRLL